MADFAVRSWRELSVHPYLPVANGAPGTNRLEPVATFNFPLKSRQLGRKGTGLDVCYEAKMEILDWVVEQGECHV